MKKALLGTLVAIVAITAPADHHKKSDGMPEMSAEEQAMMAAMAVAMTPGEAHAELAKGVGEFDANMTFWTGPDAAPMQSKMTLTRTLDLDGRVVLEHWQGQVMGAPFEGRGRVGYDNVTKRFWSTWTDNMSTGLLVMYGELDEKTGTMKFAGENVHPMTGAPYKVRSEGTTPSAEVEKMDMFEDHGAGEYKSMSFTLTRR